jgi:uncharacterized protein YuzE
MRVTYDQYDMAYVHFAPASPGSVAHTEPLIIDLPNSRRHRINLDFDEQGQLIGIEIEGARGALPEPILAGADRPEPRGRG